MSFKLINNENNAQTWKLNIILGFSHPVGVAQDNQNKEVICWYEQIVFYNTVHNSSEPVFSLQQLLQVDALELLISALMHVMSKLDACSHQSPHRFDI